MSNLVIIDGYSLLEIGDYYSRREDKVSTGGVSYLLSRIAYYTKQNFDIAVVFDSNTNTTEFIEGYRKHRRRNKRVLFTVDVLEEQMKLYDFPVYREDGKEACEIIYNLYGMNFRRYDEITILSKERSLACLVSSKSVFLEPTRTGTKINCDNFCYAIERNTMVPFNTYAMHRMLYGDGDAIGVLFNAQYRSEVMMGYWQFCEQEKIPPEQRSFAFHINSFIKECIKDERNQKLMYDRCKNMAVSFTPNEMYIVKKKVNSQFIDLCELFGAEKACKLLNPFKDVSRYRSEEFFKNLDYKDKSDKLISDRPSYSDSFGQVRSFRGE